MTSGRYSLYGTTGRSGNASHAAQHSLTEGVRIVCWQATATTLAQEK